MENDLITTLWESLKSVKWVVDGVINDIISEVMKKSVIKWFTVACV